MKELSIEEKAKAYDEAKARMSKAYNNNRCTIGFMNEIFPELKESEDEKIRKEMIEFVKSRGGFKQEYIAWLEKQGEHANFCNKIQIGDKVTRNEDGVLVNLSQLKRVAKPVEPMIVGQEPLYDYTNANICQKDFAEQKPAEWDILSAKKGDMLSNGTIVLIVDSIEEFEGRPIINSWYFADSEKFYGKGTSECDRWEVGGFRTATKIECNYLLKMIADAEYEWDADRKELKKIEQKPAWSEEDELHIRELESLVKQVWATAEHGNDKDTIHKMSDLSFFLKTLKPQPKQEWSEEDEGRLDIIFERIERGLIVDKDDIDRLKSLKDRYTWKPSDEQMDALRYVTNFDYGGHKAILVSLYEQLKKLKV